MNETRNLSNLFGKYELEAKIGSGGMAVVYRAFDPARKRRVALKILHSFLAAKDDSEVKRRFHRESEIIAQLDHPNIVRIFDHGEVNGTPYLTMEYMSRGNLAQRFEEPTPISLQTTSFLLTQIADGLDYAHQHGIIHRDIKLENVLLDDYNRPALTDFGIARVLDGTRLTGTSVIVGTPLTMSPEQSLGNYPNLDHRSDLYSLAVMAYLMTTGYFPFTGDEPLAILHKHLSALPPVPSRVNTALPPELDIVLLKGLAKEPGERYQTGSDFAVAFKDVVSQVETQTGSIVQIGAPNPITPAMTRLMTDKTTDTIFSPAVTEQMPPLPQSRRYRKSDLGIGVLLALVLAIAGFLFGKSQIQTVAQVPSLTPTLFDPDGTVSYLMMQTFESYTETPTASPTDGPTETPTNTLDPSITPTVTHTPTDTHTPSVTPTATSTATFIPNANGEVIGSVAINAREGPSIGEEVIFSIPPGTEVQLVGRTKDSSWLQVSNGRGEKGWVSARLLDTSFSVTRLPIIEEPTPTYTPSPTNTLRPGETAEPTNTPSGSSSGGSGSGGVKSKTPTPAPTDTPSRTPTTAPPTDTPTRTPSRTPTNVPPTPIPPTPVPAIQISFSANPAQIENGNCSTLSWSVSNADVVHLDGLLVGFNSSTLVCPNSNDTYTLNAHRNSDGASMQAQATIIVVEPPTPEPPTPEPPTPELPTPEPPTPEPPTPEPPTPEGTEPS